MKKKSDLSMLRGKNARLLLLLLFGFVLPRVSLLAQEHPTAGLAASLSVQCEKGQRLIFEVSNAQDWIHIDLGDGVLKEFMVSDDPTYAMRVYCDAAKDNPLIKIYANDLKIFKAPSNAITSLQISEAPNLKELILFENNLKGFSLNGLGQLERLDLSSNELTSLDLSQ